MGTCVKCQNSLMVGFIKEEKDDESPICFLVKDLLFFNKK
jgi:hypothetical protein